MAISIEATVSIVAVVLAIVPICISGVKYWRARHTHHPGEFAKLLTNKALTTLIFVKTDQRTMYYLSITPGIGLCRETKARRQWYKPCRGKIHVFTVHEVSLPMLDRDYD